MLYHHAGRIRDIDADLDYRGRDEVHQLLSPEALQDVHLLLLRQTGMDQRRWDLRILVPEEIVHRRDISEVALSLVIYLRIVEVGLVTSLELDTHSLLHLLSAMLCDKVRDYRLPSTWHSVDSRDGKVSEEGTHTELVQKGGLYARMWKEYNQAVKWRISQADPAESVSAQKEEVQ